MACWLILTTTKFHIEIPNEEFLTEADKKKVSNSIETYRIFQCFYFFFNPFKPTILIRMKTDKMKLRAQMRKKEASTKAIKNDLMK